MLASHLFFNHLQLPPHLHHLLCHHHRQRYYTIAATTPTTRQLDLLDALKYHIPQIFQTAVLLV